MLNTGKRFAYCVLWIADYRQPFDPDVPPSQQSHKEFLPCIASRSAAAIRRLRRRNQLGRRFPNGGEPSRRRIERSIGSKRVGARAWSSVGLGRTLTSCWSVIVWPVARTCLYDAQFFRPSSQCHRPSTAGRHPPRAIVQRRAGARQAHLENHRPPCCRLPPTRPKLGGTLRPYLFRSPSPVQPVARPSRMFHVKHRLQSTMSLPLLGRF